MDTIEQLIKSLKEAKAELEKNQNCAPGMTPNMTKEEMDKSAISVPSSSPVVGIPAAKVKEAKIKNLQSKIDSGTYKPDSKKIAEKMLKEEMLSCGENGQWDIKKWNMEKRCWEGYEPTPGKKAYEDGSCKPVSKQDLNKAKDMSGDEIDSNMLMSQLQSIEHHIKEIRSKINPKDIAPDWVKSQVAQAANDLSGVSHYILGIKGE